MDEELNQMDQISQSLSKNSGADSDVNANATSEKKKGQVSQHQKNLQTHLQQLQKSNRLKGIKEIADYEESKEEEILKRIEEEQRLKKQSKKQQKILNSSDLEYNNNNIGLSSLSSSSSSSSSSSNQINEVKPISHSLKSGFKIRRASSTTNNSSITNLSIDSADPLSVPPPEVLNSPTYQGRKRTNTLSSWFQKFNSNEVQSNQSQPQSQPQSQQRPHSPVLRRPSRQLSYASALSKRTPVFGPHSTFPNLNDGDDDEIISLLLDSDLSDTDSISDSVSGDDPKPFTADTINENKQDAALSYTLSKGETIKLEVTKKLEKLGFFDPKFERIHVILKFLRGYAIIVSLIMGIFGLYWGCLYHREKRFVNLSFLLILDDPITYQNLEIDDYFSNSLVNASELSNVKTLAGWEIKYYKDFTTNTTDLENLFKKRIYHEKNWAIIYVKPNSTLDYFNALQNDDNNSFNFSDIYHVYYETGRNLAGVSGYISKAIENLQLGVLKLQQSEISKPLISYLNQSQINNSLNNLFTPIIFSKTDLTSSNLLNPITLGPQQFGLTYLHLLSLMQFAFFQPFHLKIENKLNNKSFVLYRLVSSQITYITIALAYTLVQIAFGINIYTAYSGKAGFAIFWIFTYLMLSALGGVNENIALLIQSLIPNITPTWMFFWMVVNIAPTYYPLSLSPKFYRYAYAMPIFNGYETYRILLFNTWKPATLARNVVVLIVWVCVTNIALPFTMKFYTKRKTEQTVGKIKELKKLKKLRKRAANLTDKGLQKAADAFHAHSSTIHTILDKNGEISPEIPLTSSENTSLDETSSNNSPHIGILEKPKNKS